MLFILFIFLDINLLMNQIFVLQYFFSFLLHLSTFALCEFDF